MDVSRVFSLDGRLDDVTASGFRVLSKSRLWHQFLTKPSLIVVRPRCREWRSGLSPDFFQISPLWIELSGFFQLCCTIEKSQIIQRFRHCGFLSQVAPSNLTFINLLFLIQLLIVSQI